MRRVLAYRSILFPVRRSIFARHGESEYSARGAAERRLAVACGLTAAGLEQARAARRRRSRDEPLDLCVTTRASSACSETADEALRGRDVPRLVVPELERPALRPVRGRRSTSTAPGRPARPRPSRPGAGGESRHAIVERYARGFRLAARPARGDDPRRRALAADLLRARRARGPRAGRARAARRATRRRIGSTAEPSSSGRSACLEAWVAAPTW